MPLIGVVNGTGTLLNWKGLAYLDPTLALFLWRFRPVNAILLGVIFLQEGLRLVEPLPVALIIVLSFFTVSPKWQPISTGVLVTLLACKKKSRTMYVVNEMVSKY